MPEQMTKQDAIETLEVFRNDYMREGSAICRAINIAIDALRQSTIEPEVRHWRWIPKDSKTAKCPCCGWWQHAKTYYLPDDIAAFSKCYRFCTSCGARMDGGADNA